MESDLTGGRVCAAATVPHANHTPPAATQGVWVFRPVSAGIGGGGPEPVVVLPGAEREHGAVLCRPAPGTAGTAETRRES